MTAGGEDTSGEMQSRRASRLGIVRSDRMLLFIQEAVAVGLEWGTFFLMPVAIILVGEFYRQYRNDAYNDRIK